jgi:hypothetical protein
MRRLWPQFEVIKRGNDYATWIGPLVGIERPHKLAVEFGLPIDPATDQLFRCFPLVFVLSPPLQPNPKAEEEAPLPHVYFNEHDIAMSPLCLFDPIKQEWSHNDFIARTTISWAADWLACYEGWLATGRWFGGGRHARQQINADNVST